MYKTLSVKTVHKNKWYRIDKHKFQDQNKKTGEYFIIEKGNAVMIIPVTKEGKIILIKEYRYPLGGKWCFELPCGSVKKGKNSLKSAKEELEEETGYTAKSWKKIGCFAPWNGVTSEICDVFIATGLKRKRQKLEWTEIIDVLEVGFEEAYGMVEKNKIIDGMTLAALTLAKKHLKEN